MNPKITTYISKATIWQPELKTLREILLECGLDEEMKWGKPAYLHNGKIIAVMQAFKSYFALLFYNGHEPKDDKKVLVKTGPNTIKGRQIRFENTEHIKKLDKTIKALVKEAVMLEKEKNK